MTGCSKNGSNGLAEQGESSLKISTAYQKVFAFRHRKSHRPRPACMTVLALLKLPDAEGGGIEGVPKMMSPSALGELDKSKNSGEDDVNASLKASILTSFSLARDQITSQVQEGWNMIRQLL